MKSEQEVEPFTRVVRNHIFKLIAEGLNIIKDVTEARNVPYLSIFRA